MTRLSVCQFAKFREKFVSDRIKTNFASWFPGHMYKGMLQMQAKLAIVDCIVEVHDARIPFSGRNPKFYQMLSAIKPLILVLNKKDLADMTQKEKIKKHLLKDNVQHVLFTDCKASSKSGVEKILPTAIELMKHSDSHNRFNRSSFSLMVIGIPNIGKSSVINKLRNIHLKQGKATTVGALPGITKSVLEKIKISENPLVYLYDTPGIMTPSIDSFEVGLKLALCRTLNDSRVGEDLMADYLLFWLNKHKNFRYVDYLQLNEPLDDIRMVLIHIAKQFNKIQKIKTAEGNLVTMPDLTSSANHFLKGFREGHFGKILLDCDLLNKID